MGLENLSRQILFSVESRKQKLDLSLRKERDLLEKEAKAEIASFKSELTEKTKQEQLVQKNKLVNGYKKQAKQIVLDAKSKIIEQVKVSTLDKIQGFTASDRQKMLDSMITIAKERMEYDTIICNDKDCSYIKKKVKSSVSVVCTKDVSGLIFTAKKGKEILDLTIASYFAHLFDEHEDKIQELVFEE